MNLEIRRQIENLFKHFKVNQLTIEDTEIGSWEFELCIGKQSIFVISIDSTCIEGYIYLSTEYNSAKLYFHYGSIFLNENNIWWEGSEEEFYKLYY